MIDLKVFKNKNVLIIGSAKGFGKELAFQLNEGGANLFLLDKEPQEETLARAKYFIFDAESSTPCYEQLVSELAGGLDAMIYIVRGRGAGDVESLTSEQWDSDINLSLKSAFFQIQSLLPALKENSSEASILLVSSICSSLVGSESITYHLAKAGIDQLTRYLAIHLGKYNIRVNAVQPGFLVHNEHKSRFYGEDNLEYRELACGLHPLRKIGHDIDIANPCLFLLSEASAFITGQVLCIDGGLTV
ncbi:SDR family NAD(P)-dependent oxidoreductase, partial [Oleiphilus sp. HI0117]